MAGKTYVAKQETSEAIQTDTTAIRNTLGIFPGGGIEDTVAAKLLELEGRIDEIAAKQNYQDDDFYIECGKNYTALNGKTLSTTNITLVDVTGTGTIHTLTFGKSLVATIYIDDEIFAQTNGVNTYGAYFGVTSGSDRFYKLQKRNDTSSSSSLFCGAALNFKKYFKVVANNHTDSTTNDTYQIIYGIGGAAQ